MHIKFIKGDATQPQAKGIKFIAHICNNLGGWGRGFVLSISKRWEQPEEHYRLWHKFRHNALVPDDNFELGNIQIVSVEKYIFVINMIAQHGMKSGSKGPPIRYDALRKCLEKTAEQAIKYKASIHMPRIGTGLSCGKWELIEPIIQETMKDLDVTVYDY